MQTRNVAVIAFLVLVVSACSGATGLPLRDDFSDPNSGWDRVNEVEGSTDYQDGGYRIFVDETNYSIWANPNKGSYADVSIEVDVRKVAGPDDNEFGVICRHADPGSYYAAVISSDGFFGFWRRSDGNDLQMIGYDQFQASEAIHLGSESNHIRLDCVGSTLTLYTNGELLGEVSDSTIASGDVGLYAGTFDLAGTDVLFDNFVASAP